MKKILKVFLSLALFFMSILPTSILAEEPSRLMSIISDMYSEMTDFKAYDESGTDITNRFLANIESYYSMNDEEMIMDYMATSGIYLNRKIVNEIPTPFSVTYTKCYVNEEFVEVLLQTDPAAGGSVVIFYTITAEPVYILETGEVLTNPQPVATLTSADISLNLLKIHSFSSMTSLSNDGKTITYSWTFQLRMRYSQYLTVYDVAFERVNQSMKVTPSTY